MVFLVHISSSMWHATTEAAFNYFILLLRHPYDNNMVNITWEYHIKLLIMVNGTTGYIQSQLIHDNRTTNA